VPKALVKSPFGVSSFTRPNVAAAYAILFDVVHFALYRFSIVVAEGERLLGVYEVPVAVPIALPFCSTV
jgi:hypothetical protein